MKLSLIALALGGSISSAANLADQWGYHDPKFCKPQTGDIKDALGACFECTDKINQQIRPLIKNLVKQDYFNYYKVDLSGEGCPFRDDEGMCGNKACAVDPVQDESELPEFWRSQYLGKLADNSIARDITDDEDISDSCLNDASVVAKKGCFNGGCDEQMDYCYPEDESRHAKGVYISLMDNPERYTGYIGSHANKIWRAAYLENCFGYFGEDDGGKSQPVAKPQTPAFPDAAIPLSRVITDNNKYEIQEVGGKVGQDAMNTQEQCVEQRLFYRLISGMHASVSTHLCVENLNKTTGEWGPNLDCFMTRVGNHPERIQNMYFNYALVQKAIAKLTNYINYLYFCREDPDSDGSTRQQLLKLAEAVRGEDNGKHLFDETLAFKSPQGAALKDEFRKRVRNVNQMMACVGCDRCRLWGKLQTAGYGTALKVLFELPEHPDTNASAAAQVLRSFKRTELVSLINVFDRLSKSIEAVSMFRAQVQQENGLLSKKPESSWDNEWTLAWEGIKFIFRSWIDFPKNLYHLSVSFVDQAWNKFIGRDNSEPFHIDL